MTELTVVRGPGKGSSITLVPGRSASIGSAPGAGIRVGGSDVAGQHVVVKALKGGGFGAKALAGPFQLNGAPTEATRLRDGDVLTIGDTEIRYVESAEGDVPTELGGFRLLGVLGTGGWGVVWRAEQVSLGREVALKVLSQERTSDPVFVGRFQAEARNAARLHHPNVVQVFDVDHDGDTWFYSMELMHGGSLEQRLQREGRLPVDDALQTIRDAAKGLAFAEQMRIVHRDIKPDNLMVDRHGHVKIADLGLAMTDEDEETKLVGTPHFMSPEQVRRQTLDQRSDLYSLGCTLYRLITGRTPFQGASSKQILRAQLEETAPRADETDATVPTAVADLIERLMAKSPDDRYASAAELVEELEHLLTPPSSRGPWVLVAAAVVVIATAIVLFVVLTQPKPTDPTIVERVVKDPAAQRAIEENRRIEAENALLRANAQGLTGIELASALEAVAAEHPDTPAARQASERAEEIRERERQRIAAARLRQARVEAAIQALRTSFSTAMANGDLLAAAGVLDGRPDDLAVTGDPAITAARSELDGNLRAAARQRLDALRTAVTTAVDARDPDAIRRALVPLEQIVGEGGWPEPLVDDRAALAEFLSVNHAAAERISNELVEAAQAEAWTALRTAVFDPDGMTSRIAALQFAAAATALDDVAARFPDSNASSRALALAPALRAAGRYVARLQTAAAVGELEMIDPRGDEAVQLVGFAPGTGLAIRTGSRSRQKDETVPIATLLAAPTAWFPRLGDAAAEERAAFLGALTLGRLLTDGRAYLGQVRADDDTSGTGPQAFQVALDGAHDARETLRASEQQWASAMSDELEATTLVARGLAALAGRRNLTASRFIDRALADHGDAIAVRCLR